MRDGFRIKAVNPRDPLGHPVEVVIPTDLVRKWYKESSVEYYNLETAKEVLESLMASHFLEGLVEGEPGFSPKPWYNRHGDCIVFKAQDVGVVAERIDDILTLYFSAEDNRPVGFQIKGVKYLLDRFRCNAVQISGELQKGRLTVSLAFILLAAYDSGPRTISRRVGYAQAQAVTSPPECSSISLDEVVVG